MKMSLSILVLVFFYSVLCLWCRKNYDDHNNEKVVLVRCHRVNRDGWNTAGCVFLVPYINCMPVPKTVKWSLAGDRGAYDLSPETFHSSPETKCINEETYEMYWETNHMFRETYEIFWTDKHMIIFWSGDKSNRSQDKWFVSGDIWNRWGDKSLFVSGDIWFVSWDISEMVPARDR
jgi:hypothetical protein